MPEFSRLIIDISASDTAGPGELHAEAAKRMENKAPLGRTDCRRIWRYCPVPRPMQSEATGQPDSSGRFGLIEADYASASRVGERPLSPTSRHRNVLAFSQ